MTALSFVWVHPYSKNSRCDNRFKDMDLVEQVHIFGLTNIHNISLMRLFSQMLNYAKPRIMKKKQQDGLTII